MESLREEEKREEGFGRRKRREWVRKRKVEGRGE